MPSFSSEILKTWLNIAALKKCSQEREALEAQQELETKLRVAAEKEEEAQRLQMELEEAKKRMDENQRQLEEALNAPPKIQEVYIVKEVEHDERDESHKEHSKCCMSEFWDGWKKNWNKEYFAVCTTTSLLVRE